MDPVSREMVMPGTHKHASKSGWDRGPASHSEPHTQQIMAYLNQHGKATIAQVSEALGLSHPEVEEYLGTLERGGRVERTSDGFLRARKMAQS
jgi:predicted ArsR family transcriptional regulator